MSLDRARKRRVRSSYHKRKVGLNIVTSKQQKARVDLKKRSFNRGPRGIPTTLTSLIFGEVHKKGFVSLGA
jgi:hypothetical protein